MITVNNLGYCEKLTSSIFTNSNCLCVVNKSSQLSDRNTCTVTVVAESIPLLDARN